MKITDLFFLHRGNGFELYNMNETTTKSINFVSRTAQNNGVVAKVDKISDVEPFPAGFITVALGGSVLSAFVQKNPFYTAFHIMVLEPKKEMRLEEKLFYCMCIQNNAYRYSYGRQANKTLKYLEIPDRVPEWVYKILIQPIETSSVEKTMDLNSKKWKEFTLGGETGLFNFKKGKRLTRENMEIGKTNYLGAISENNGVREHINVHQEDWNAKNCITVNYNGSVGEAFYQCEPFWASDDVNILYPSGWKLNKYIALFIVTIIKANRYRFSYGRKWTMNKMKESVVKLPSRTDGTPDFEYMENYIKSLPYSDRI
ncbi:MAG: restriction endonuclease subunit S [Oscillospiraceae bacterium]